MKWAVRFWMSCSEWPGGCRLLTPHGFACSLTPCSRLMFAFSLLQLNHCFAVCDVAASPWYVCHRICVRILKDGRLHVSLSLLQDWRQTLVSGLAAFLWIWHQHSQLHRFGKYLFSVSLRVTVYILWWSVDSQLTHRNKCFLLPRTLLQSNKPATLPQPWCTPLFFLPSDALRCTSTSWSVSPQFPPFLPRDTSTVPLVWSLSSSSAFCHSFISLLDTPVCSFSVPAGCRMSLSMLQRQRAELTSCVSS